MNVDHESGAKNSPGGWKSVKYILGNETFEKMASMSLAANLVLYLRTQYNLDNVASVNIVMILSGFGNILPLAGAFLADASIGKFKTILYGSIASLLGISALALSAGVRSLRPAHCPAQSAECHHPANWWQMAVLLGSLVLMSIGGAGIRTCNISFGADQFDTTTEKGRQQLGSFCNWYFFLFTAAIVFSLTGVAYLQTNVSWFYGFLVPAFCFVLSITVFLIGRHTYVLVEPHGSVLVDLLKVVTAAFHKRSWTLCGKRTSFYNPTREPTRTTRLAFLDKAAMLVHPSELDGAGKPVNSWRLCPVQDVENLKCVITSLPILLAGVGCFIVLNQPGTFGILQAIQMKRGVGKHFEIPPAWVKLSIMITLSIWVLFYEKFYVPVMKRNRLTVKQRINIGILLSILCMLVAGTVEKFRRESALRQRTFESPMSVLYLMIPFSLSGLVEAFAAITLIEHVTMEWPEKMKTFAAATFFLSMSLSSYLNSTILWVINKAAAVNGNKPWLSGNDFNKNRLDYYYYTIGVFGLLNLVYFHAFAKRYLETTHVLVRNDHYDDHSFDGEDETDSGSPVRF